jgi:hypothetical protein
MAHRMNKHSRVEPRDEPCGDTSFNEGKEEDETKDDRVTSSNVGFLFVSGAGGGRVCMYCVYWGGGGG